MLSSFPIMIDRMPSDSDEKCSRIKQLQDKMKQKKL